MKRLIRHPLAGCILGIGLLAVLLGLNQTHLTPEDAADYHANVRQAVLDIPLRVGPWRGKDQEIVPAAVELLRPNVILSRQYTHRDTGESVTLLIVHCRDARDLLGHYPPVCYPGQGWRIVEGYNPVNKLFSSNKNADDWRCYPMTHGSVQTGDVIQMVYHKMLLPDGTATTDMDRVQAIAGDYEVRHYGAAQVQVIVNESLKDKSEIEIQPLLDALEPAIAAISDRSAA